MIVHIEYEKFGMVRYGCRQSDMGADPHWAAFGMKERNQPPSSEPFSMQDIAREALLRDGHHTPMLIVEGTNLSGIVQIDRLGATFDERVRGMTSIGFQLAIAGNLGSFRQEFFINEGWMSIVNQVQAANTRPATDPNRREVLIISHEQVFPPMKDILCFEMKRDAQGKLIEATEIIQPHDSVQSPLLDAFVLGYKAGGRVFPKH